MIILFKWIELQIQWQINISRQTHTYNTQFIKNVINRATVGVRNTYIRQLSEIIFTILQSDEEIRKKGYRIRKAMLLYILNS